jgi:hypothetical protein
MLASYIEDPGSIVASHEATKVITRHPIWDIKNFMHISMQLRFGHIAKCKMSYKNVGNMKMFSFISKI